MSRPVKTTILIADYFSQEHHDKLSADFPAVAFIPLPLDGSVPPSGQDASALLRAAMSKEALARTLAEAPALRWVHTSTAGFDWLLIPELIARVERGSLEVTRSAASYSIAMGEFVIAAMFLLMKQFPAFMAAQKEHRWTTLNPLELAGMTVGIVGAGAVGSEIAQRAKALGMHVIGTRRRPQAVSGFAEVWSPDQLPSLLASADVVVLATPLTSETRGMIDEEALRLMKSSAYLINVGRGALLNTTALERAMLGGWIAGALLDVFETEPLPAESPLWDLPNVVLTPHTSFRSPHSVDRILAEFSHNLSNFLSGKPLENKLRELALGY